MDIYTKDDRSRVMSSVKSQNTKPEIVVRSMLHRLGYRFRLHSTHLPGKPDIVLPRHGKVIFVNGCFWHQHEGCPRAKRPKTNRLYWNAKLDRNVARDLENYERLASQSWRMLVIWECETQQRHRLERILLEFLD